MFSLILSAISLIFTIFIVIFILFLIVLIIKVFFGSLAFMGAFIMKAICSAAFWVFAIFVLLCLIF